MDLKELNKSDIKALSEKTLRVSKVPILMVGLMVTMFMFVIVWAVFDSEEQTATTSKEYDKSVDSRAFDDFSKTENVAGLATLIDTNKSKSTQLQPSRFDDNGNLKAATARKDASVDSDDVTYAQNKLKVVNELTTEQLKIDFQRKNAIEEYRLERERRALESGMDVPVKSRGFKLAISNESKKQQIADLDKIITTLENQLSDPKESYKQAIKEVRADIGNIDKSNNGLYSSNQHAPNYEQFDNADPNRFKLDSNLDKAKSFQIRAGTIIPATLISGINSDLPGQIAAQISSNVYDTTTGKYLLIPQGAKLLGQYDSNVVYGQNRILIAWQRITFPNGDALDIGALSGADPAGFAGFSDQTNNHYFRIFGSSLLMSAIGVSAQLSKQNLGSTNAINQAFKESLLQQFGQLSANLIAKNLSVAPTLTIRPGFRFIVVVSKDIDLKHSYQ